VKLELPPTRTSRRAKAPLRCRGFDPYPHCRRVFAASPSAPNLAIRLGRRCRITGRDSPIAFAAAIVTGALRSPVFSLAVTVDVPCGHSGYLWMMDAGRAGRAEESNGHRSDAGMLTVPLVHWRRPVGPNTLDLHASATPARQIRVSVLSIRRSGRQVAGTYLRGGKRVCA